MDQTERTAKREVIRSAVVEALTRSGGQAQLVGIWVNSTRVLVTLPKKVDTINLLSERVKASRGHSGEA